MIEMFLKEMEQEAKTTRKMLAILPEDKYDWKPHEKSMTLQHLATHVAELPGWISMAIKTDELDFENNGYAPKTITNNKELIKYFEELLVEAKVDLEKATDEILPKQWILTSIQCGSAALRAWKSPAGGEVMKPEFNGSRLVVLAALVLALTLGLGAQSPSSNPNQTIGDWFQP